MKDLIRIANEVTALERMAGEPSYKDYVKKKKNKGEKPLSKEDWEARVKGKGKKDKDSGKGPLSKVPEDKVWDIVKSRMDWMSNDQKKRAMKLFDEIPEDAVKDAGALSDYGWGVVDEKGWDEGEGDYDFYASLGRDSAQIHAMIKDRLK